jgi:hypothetical protein
MSVDDSLNQNSVTMAECLPTDFVFMDTYQAGAWQQIKWDDNHNTIKGLQPVGYMLKGLNEELDEITGPDKMEPGYSRLGALMMIEGNGILQAGMETPSAVTRHLKEFGDSSWYLANYLTIFGIQFSRVIEPGKVAWHLDNISQPRQTEADALESEKQHPWANLFHYAHSLTKAASGPTKIMQDGTVIRKHRDERLTDEKNLIVASGRFVLAMSHVLRARYDISYEEVLDRNHSKLEKRIADGTVFDKSGGDDR